MELLTLTAPEVQPQVVTANYQIAYINFNWESPTIVIGLRGENGELKVFTYGGNNPDNTPADRTKARNLMIALNKMNFTTNSLQKRVIQQLVTDGFIAGTVTGTPD